MSSILKVTAEIRSGSEKRRCASAEAVAGVVLVEAGAEDARDLEGSIAGVEAKRGEFTLRGDDLDAVADFGTDCVGEIFADDDGRDDGG
jgi:hypothetical protein